MKFYLSSYRMGSPDNVEKLKKMLPSNKKTALISNAHDLSKDFERIKKSEQENIMELKAVGLNSENLDLKKYFGKEKELEKKLNEYGVIWVRGGNVFVLRLAMKLCGFDNIMKKLINKKDILYGGYSAGGCVLSPTLKGLELIDDITQKPYGDIPFVWEGLNIIDYSFIPHYKSDHFESEGINKEVEYLKKNKIKYKAISDGEVIIFEI